MITWCHGDILYHGNHVIGQQLFNWFFYIVFIGINIMIAIKNVAIVTAIVYFHYFKVINGIIMIIKFIYTQRVS